MRLSLNKKQPVYILITVLTVCMLVLVVALSQNSTRVPSGMRQVKSYNPKGLCLAVDDPECGYCPEEPIYDKCYVKQGELEQYR